MLKKLKALIMLLSKELPLDKAELKNLYEEISLIIGTLPKEKSSLYQEKLDTMFTKSDIECNEYDFRLFIALLLLELSIINTDIDIDVEQTDLELEVELKENVFAIDNSKNEETELEIKDSELNIDKSKKADIEIEVKENELYIDKSKKNNILINFINYGIIGNKNIVIEDVNNHNKHVKQFND